MLPYGTRSKEVGSLDGQKRKDHTSSARHGGEGGQAGFRLRRLQPSRSRPRCGGRSVHGGRRHFQQSFEGFAARLPSGSCWRQGPASLRWRGKRACRRNQEPSVFSKRAYPHLQTVGGQLYSYQRAPDKQRKNARHRKGQQGFFLYREGQSGGYPKRGYGTCDDASAEVYFPFSRGDSGACANEKRACGRRQLKPHAASQVKPL